MMNPAITAFQSHIVNIATPYNEGGIGLLVPSERIILTNEHIVRDNSSVIVENWYLPAQALDVVYLDAHSDMAFLSLPEHIHLPNDLSDLLLADKNGPCEVGASLLTWNAENYWNESIPHATLVAYEEDKSGATFLIYDKKEVSSAGNGFLTDLQGNFLGMKILVPSIHHPKLGIALTTSYLKASLEQFRQGKSKATRCEHCMTIVFESNQQHHCPTCGAYILLPSSIPAYEPQGVARTIEQVLFETGHSVHLARRGVDKWAIQKGSAKIIITYHEDSGLIMSDAYLCWLPEENKLPIYEFLLLENERMEGLTFSIKPKSREIVLSLLIFEQYFNVPTGVASFKQLFEKADFFDNILVEKYGAMWRNHKKFEKEW